MIADAHGTPYYALGSLEEARTISDAVVILEGDYGGQIYATCPASQVKCSEPALHHLLRDLDALSGTIQRASVSSTSEFR